jgi:hypothetical protein
VSLPSTISVARPSKHIKEGKNEIVWTRLSCIRFRNNEVRLQLHTLAYNLANFMRTLAPPEAVKYWSLTSLRQKLVKIGSTIVGHGRNFTFQMAEVAVPMGPVRRNPAAHSSTPGAASASASGSLMLMLQ